MSKETNLSTATELIEKIDEFMDGREKASQKDIDTKGTALFELFKVLNEKE